MYALLSDDGFHNKKSPFCSILLQFMERHAETEKREGIMPLPDKGGGISGSVSAIARQVMMVCRCGKFGKEAKDDENQCCRRWESAKGGER